MRKHIPEDKIIISRENIRGYSKAKRPGISFLVYLCLIKSFLRNNRKRLFMYKKETVKENN